MVSLQQRLCLRPTLFTSIFFKMKKLYIIAGEASGDLHGANVLKELKVIDPTINVRAWGGDLMTAEGANVVKHIRDLAFMGFVEVIQNLKTILGNIKFCKNDIRAFQPDAILMIDYPGFNLRIAKWAKKHNIKVYYYISPTIWAWKESRVYTIKKVVDHMFCILPFEADFYRKFDYDAEYVGHPLLDEVNTFRQSDNEKIIVSDRKIIALLPGSRKQEVRVKLPIMLEACQTFKEFDIIVGGAPTLTPAFYKEVIGERQAQIVYGKTYALLNSAELALVTSGTATLETALFKVPQVVCYKANVISYQIIKRLIKIRFISLVNLILDKEVVTELIQNDCTAQKMEQELLKIKVGQAKRAEMLNEYDILHTMLGGIGASKKVAQVLAKGL
jgi:lipid-A-disaccharide synthase